MNIEDLKCCGNCKHRECDFDRAVSIEYFGIAKERIEECPSN